jgi:hypothetical protein
VTNALVPLLMVESEAGETVPHWWRMAGELSQTEAIDDRDQRG